MFTRFQKHFDQLRSEETPHAVANFSRLTMQPSKKFKAEARRQDGMQRELYALLGENTPPIAVAPDNKFKNTPNWRQKVTPWTKAKFKNRARDDDLQLSHWVRGLPDEDEVYRFSRYNTKLNIPEWTNDDYALFKSDSWTLEETRYLFDLAKKYDLKWFVVHDRYSYSTRSIEDLKERYYEVCSALLKKDPNLSPADQDLLTQMQYSKASELERKAHLEHLLSRTPAEVAEEEALILESRRLESQAERLLAERNEIINLLETPQATASIQNYQTSQGLAQLHQQLLAEKSRKPKEPVRKDYNKSGIANLILQKRLSAKEELAFGVSYSDRLTPGVYLRSQKLSTMKQSAAQKTRSVLQELGISVRPVMPTAKVCAKFESLQHSISLLLETKKVQDRLETEIAILKKKDAPEGLQEPAEPAPEVVPD